MDEKEKQKITKILDFANTLSDRQIIFTIFVFLLGTTKIEPEETLDMLQNLKERIK